ncbi:hypothetical protein D3C71_2182350 [compost metagenome]
MGPIDKGRRQPRHQVDLVDAAGKEHAREENGEADAAGEQRSEDEFEVAEAGEAGAGSL